MSAPKRPHSYSQGRPVTPAPYSHVVTVDLDLRIEWVALGPVTTMGSDLLFPPAERVPGVYRFAFRTAAGPAEYIGEAGSLRNRFFSYAGAIGNLSTNTRMRNRMTRVLQEGGEVDVLIAHAALTINGIAYPVDLSNKLVRVFVEHGAVAEALASGRPVLNGAGYPPASPGSALSGSPAAEE